MDLLGGVAVACSYGTVANGTLHIQSIPVPEDRSAIQALWTVLGEVP